MSMELGQAIQPERVLRRVATGIAILDAPTLRIRYVNPFLLTLLEDTMGHRTVIDRPVSEVLPPEIGHQLLPILEHVAATGEPLYYESLPFEGFLETRGRTYWNVFIEYSSSGREGLHEGAAEENVLFISIEDVTAAVRLRLHFNAIRAISSAIAGPFALPRVLDRILQAVHEMVGSTRCAIFLIEHTWGEQQHHSSVYHKERTSIAERAMPRPYTAVIAAQRGIHTRSQDWRPTVDERTLLGRVARERRTIIVADTATVPELSLPLLDNHGKPMRPGSVLCVPIFEPQPLEDEDATTEDNDQRSQAAHGAVLGTIEIYHRRPRGFPSEEVELLEQFAQQAGLAIQNTRLFRSVDRWARDAHRHARQQANVMQAIPDGVVIFDPRWRVAEFNHAARRLLGWSQDVVGQSFAHALQQSKTKFHVDLTSSSFPEAEMERRALTGQIDEVKVIDAEGQRLTLRCSYTPVSDDQGNIFAFIVIYHDITEQAAARERIEAEVVARTQELAQRNKDLQQAQQAQEDFFTTMAHELKTPLANIRAHLSALLANDLNWPPEKQQDILRGADEQVERLASMINHFLDASRVEAGALRLQVEPILLPEMMEDLRERLEALIDSSNSTLEMLLPPQLPAVLADYELIMGVLTNLLSNAFRYAPEGDPVRLVAELVADDTGTASAVRLSVIDRGPGMTVEQQEALFTRFSTFAAMNRPDPQRPGQPAPDRRRTTTRWSPATGLGLYISRGIVEAHGSHLTLETGPGLGATFSFTLPIYQQHIGRKEEAL